MEKQYDPNPPAQCPVCRNSLAITRLECVSCSTEVTGTFALGRLATTPEPHASLLEMFLRVRGNVKEMERELGLSYPTVRARLEEAFEAAGYGRSNEVPESMSGDSTLGAELGERIRRQVHQRLASVEQQMSSLDLRPSASRDNRREVVAAERRIVLDELEAGTLSPGEAAQRLRALKERNT